MDKTSFLDDLQRRIDAVSNALPAAEVRDNLKALLSTQFAKLDLVTREEFDTQARVLARTREKLEQLQIRLDQIEADRPRGAG
ncbi:MAG: accessory factor UbiK family protein [Burkholderiaceae bacterium]